MTQYVKLVNNDIEYAPINYNGIINFNKNIKLLKENGYLPLEKTEQPEYDKSYQRLDHGYKEIDEQIIEQWEVVDFRTIEEALQERKTERLIENAEKADNAIENGYIVYKDAQFETNDKTGQKLNSKRELCITRGETSAMWLSRDDKSIELIIDTENPKDNDDFVQIGFLVEDYSNKVWMNKYMAYKLQIEDAKTIEELNNINVDYELIEE